jgi:hypothetical protein
LRQAEGVGRDLCGPSPTPIPDNSHHTEDDEQRDAQKEDEEAEDLACTVVLTGVAVTGRVEENDVDDAHGNNDGGPEPEWSSHRRVNLTLIAFCPECWQREFGAGK